MRQAHALHAMQEKGTTGASKRAQERYAAIEMDVQARAKQMADAKRTAEQGQHAKRTNSPGHAIVGVGMMSAKEKRHQERNAGRNVRRGGL